VRRGGVFFTGALGMRGIVGMGCVFARVLLVGTLVMRMLFMSFRAGRRGGCLDRSCDRHTGLRFRRRRLARVSVIIMIVLIMVLPVMIVFIMGMSMIVRMPMIVVIMMLSIGMVMLGVVGVAVFGVLAFDMLVAVMRLSGLRRIDACVFNDIALDPLAIAAAARVAVAWTAAVGAVFGFFLGLAMGAFVGLDQRLTIGDRDLVIIRVDFAEGQKTVAVAAVFDEGRLQRRLYPRDLGEVDIAAQLFALSGLEIKFLDAIAADHNDPGLFRVSGIDQHFVGHFGTLDGGGRV
jgi:hypothetical protein